ncbi:protein-disulfide isomerase [Burkholderiales bacterium JOSHI_001]|nr:protein-disulfide isomerase [Burkholderiales bacterium JOSHI_001]
MKSTHSLMGLAAAALLCAASVAQADEAVIRKNLSERIPGLSRIDEVSKMPFPGLWEVRVGADIYYTDESGNYLVDGQVIDTRTRANLTEARVNKLTAIDFAALPLKDAVVVKQGTGARKLVVFGDPNCGYCKRLEKDLLAVKDVTIYTFLMPILGPDSTAKSRDIWCAKDNGKVWRDWMVDGSAIPKSMAKCDTSALDRNLAMGQKFKINGTPAVVFEDGTRSPGALPAQQIEVRIQAAAKKS